MATVEHRPATEGGPQTRWGVCSCGWVSGVEHRGALARMAAIQDADAHCDQAEQLAGLERTWDGS